MPTLNPYLTFGGNCREAMNFYKEVLGGELSLMTVAESPFKGQMPEQFNDQVLHSSLKTATLELMATDMQPGKQVVGNDVHLCLLCKTEEEANEFFDKLSAGGTVNQPLNKMFFGILGTLTDKFGKHWMVECDLK